MPRFPTFPQGVTSTITDKGLINVWKKLYMCNVYDECH